LLLPKAQTEQRRWQSELADSPVDVEFIDPWDISIFDESREMRTVWLNLDAYRGVICISPSAAQVLVDALDAYWPMPPADVLWVCNGPRTATVLKSHSLKPVYPNTGHTTEDVLALPELKTETGDKWLIVKGIGGRVVYREALESAGASVTELEVYQRSIDQQSLNDLRSAAVHADALWLSSEYLGDKLLAHSLEQWRSWAGQWWVSSVRLHEWAHENGLSHIHIADGATPASLKNLMHQMHLK
jgi:uroporphyrinogen-III synthase